MKNYTGPKGAMEDDGAYAEDSHDDFTPRI